MVFPFCRGRASLVATVGVPAAELLARIHRGIETAWDRSLGGRPGPRRWSSQRNDIVVDPDLDRWEREVSARGVDLPIHGDFYGGNLLMQGDRIVAVLDWSDAALVPMEQEVAWAMWEFCQNEAGEELVDDVAGASTPIGARAAPRPSRRPSTSIPWDRRRLRPKPGDGSTRGRRWNRPVPRGALVAFDRLRDRRFPLTERRWDTGFVASR